VRFAFLSAKVPDPGGSLRRQPADAWRIIFPKEQTWKSWTLATGFVRGNRPPLPRRAPHPLERNPGRDEAKPSLEKEIQLVRLEGSAVFAGLDQNQKKRHKI
jgi:hypothetical protein